MGLVLLIIPPAETLLTQLDLVAVGLLALGLDLSVVGVALLAALATLADADEEQGGEEKSASTASRCVDGNFGAGGEVVPLLSESQRRRGVERILDGGVAAVIH